jgi:hypothetical protein
MRVVAANEAGFAAGSNAALGLARCSLAALVLTTGPRFNALLRSRFYQSGHATNRLHQFIWKTVTLAKILGRVER